MPVAAHLLYRPRGAEERLLVRDVHVEYMMAHRKLLRAGGAIVEQERVVGMYLLFDTDDEAVVRTFLAAEPYHRTGLFDRVHIVRFNQFIPEPEEGFLARLLDESRSYIRAPNTRA